VLAGQAGDYGLPPSRASAIVALMTLLHYGDGAFFPKGGSGGLRDALVRIAEQNGARFRVSARVRRIIVQDKQVRGVELESGERMDADVVVSDADPTVTLGKLVEPEHLPPRLRRKVSRIEPSLAPFSIFLGMRRDLRDRGLGRFNVWTYPSWDIDSLYAPILEGQFPERPWLFLSSNSIKDDSGVLAPAGCCTLEVTTFLSFEMFRRWQGIPPGQRGPEYQALKQEIAERMLSEVERCWPGLVGDVEVQEYATPLTNVDYVGAVQGAGYGPAATPSQWGPFRFSTATPIQNLLLAGAGVFFHGVASALLSGKEAAVAAARHAGSSPVGGPQE
jgi:phytoene dehydrogenase-like protein